MISNQILQSNIEGLKEITRIDLCVCDVEGKVLASTFEHAEEYESSILAFVDSPADSQVIQGYQFFKVFDEHQLEYILLAKGGSDDVYMVGKLAAFQIQNLLVAYKERFDKDNFIKNLLLDNLLLVDIYNRAKKLHIQGMMLAACQHAGGLRVKRPRVADLHASAQLVPNANHYVARGHSRRLEHTEKTVHARFSGRGVLSSLSFIAASI